MSLVGIIANPASGKDIRRLVAHGTVFDNVEKTNIVQRVLLGLAATGVDKVLFMPDTYGIGEKAIDKLGGSEKLGLEVSFLRMRIGRGGEDSTLAAGMMRDAGAGCIIVLGGDGTSRAVAKKCGDVPLLPISTGTNNVFPYMIEGTTAGLAAGVIAREITQETIRTKKLNIWLNGKIVDLALIDAVVSADLFVASRALWDMSRVKTVVATRGEAHNIGMSAVGGCFYPVTMTDRQGLFIEIGEGKQVIKAPIAPGIIAEVGIKGYRPLEVGERVQVQHKPSTLALDGERELRIRPDDLVEIELATDGPLVVDVKKTLRGAVQQNFFAAV
jgi:predicted polyphosphate/ATP-dependent NAD kinase